MKVEWSPRALRDVTEIYEYILPRSAKGAATVMRRINATVDLIGKFPGVGRSVRAKLGIRALHIGKYPYRVYFAAEPDTVFILHVRHTSRRSPRVRDL